MAVFLLIVAGLLSFTFTRGLDFLASISIIFIGVQAVRAINFHLLAPRSEPGSAVKSNEPFRFRAAEEMIISGALALAGIASLAGMLNAGNLAGGLALCAATVGALNVVATRRCGAIGSAKSP